MIILIATIISNLYTVSCILLLSTVEEYFQQDGVKLITCQEIGGWRMKVTYGRFIGGDENVFSLPMCLQKKKQKLELVFSQKII